MSCLTTAKGKALLLGRRRASIGHGTPKAQLTGTRPSAPDRNAANAASTPAAAAPATPAAAFSNRYGAGRAGNAGASAARAPADVRPVAQFAIGAALRRTLPVSATSSSSPRPPGAPGGGGKSLADGLSFWDAATHNARQREPPLTQPAA